MSEWQTLRIYVSTGFGDMHAERELLATRVFPELRCWCERRRLRLEEIDPRWGCTELEATRNGKAVQVCLNEIDRCRPFFLGFVGQRYGWVPRADDVTPWILQQYYGLENELEAGRSLQELEVIHGVCRPLGLLTPGQGTRVACEHGLFYLREPLQPRSLERLPTRLQRIFRAPQTTRSTRFREKVIQETERPIRRYRADWSTHPGDRTPEHALPLRCPTEIGDLQERWRSQWRELGVVVDGLAIDERSASGQQAREINEKLTAGRLVGFRCAERERPLDEVIREDLQRAITACFPSHRTCEVFQGISGEWDRSEEVVNARVRDDNALEKYLDELDWAIESSSNRLFVLSGPAGVGKTTLLANWVKRRRARDRSGETIHVRFVGGGPRTKGMRAILISLLHELEAFGKLTTWALENLEDPQRLRRRFSQLLAFSGRQGRTVLVIDGVAELDELNWLPWVLPKGVKLVVSYDIHDEEHRQALDTLKKDPRVRVHELGLLANLEQRRQFGRNFFGRNLTPWDDIFLAALAPARGMGLPLFFETVLHEGRSLVASPVLAERIQESFGEEVMTAFGVVFSRRELADSSSPIPSSVVVPLLIGGLAHAFDGLPEALLVSLVHEALDVPAERSDEVEDIVQLVLKRFSPYLLRNGGGYGFRHRLFRSAARDRYASSGLKPGHGARSTKVWHSLLSKACRRWPELGVAAAQYSLANLVRHQIAAGDNESAVETLSDFGFLYQRVRAFGREESRSIADELEDLSSSPGLARLPDVLRRGLDGWRWFFESNEEAVTGSVRAARPEIDLLQLASTPEQGGVVASSVARWLSSTGPEVDWLHPRCSLPVLRDSSSLRNAAPSAIFGLELHPDGRRVVVGGDGSSKPEVWDLERERCLHVLEGHTDRVHIVTLHPDGRRLISASRDLSLRVWDLASGECSRALAGHEDPVTSIALHPDGRHAVTASFDRTLKVWDLDAGECVVTLVEETEWISFVKILPDGLHIVAACGDKALRVYDLASGLCLQQLDGHEERIQDLVVLSRDQKVMTASEDWTIKVWSLERGECIHTLDEHDERITDLALHPEMVW